MPAQAILTTISTVPGTVRREIRRWSATLKVGSAMLLVIVLAGIFAPVVAPFDPYFQDYDRVLLPPGGTHLFGTDQLGRDLFSRVIYGIRIDLMVGFIITFVPMIYGVAIGALAGYYGGVLDSVLMRLLDTAIAFPFLVLIIVVIAILGPGVHSIYIAVFLVAWTMYARLARAEMLVERSKDYMLAAKTLGYPTSRIIFRHALPNIIGSSVVFSMADFVLNILLLSGLSFLGLGIQPPEPEWGAMVAEGRDFIFENWWICTLPGLAIVVTGTALSLIGDGLARRLGQRHQAIL
ncbi:MAG: putative D,D-dipeptide transport system permease protein DdpC [Alphaproteobacteria bacterium MarineAlpha10_Bin1]|nr:MAG: putative D,D-dipeptide transport system permease protein DdpC [Alphaproteobacteria bacterium MarineAlpha10_Bin1]